MAHRLQCLWCEQNKRDQVENGESQWGSRKTTTGGEKTMRLLRTIAYISITEITVLAMTSFLN